MAEQTHSDALNWEYGTGGPPGEQRDAMCSDRVDQVFIQTASLKAKFPSLCLCQCLYPYHLPYKTGLMLRWPQHTSGPSVGLLKPTLLVCYVSTTSLSDSLNSDVSNVPRAIKATRRKPRAMACVP